VRLVSRSFEAVLLIEKGRSKKIGKIDLSDAFILATTLPDRLTLSKHHYLYSYKPEPSIIEPSIIVFAAFIIFMYH